jgi:hypothetical protein
MELRTSQLRVHSKGRRTSASPIVLRKFFRHILWITLLVVVAIVLVMTWPNHTPAMQATNPRLDTPQPSEPASASVPTDYAFLTTGPDSLLAALMSQDSTGDDLRQVQSIIKGISSFPEERLTKPVRAIRADEVLPRLLACENENDRWTLGCAIASELAETQKHDPAAHRALSMAALIALEHMLQDPSTTHEERTRFSWHATMRAFQNDLQLREIALTRYPPMLDLPDEPDAMTAMLYREQMVFFANRRDNERFDEAARAWERYVPVKSKDELAWRAQYVSELHTKLLFAGP